MKKCPHCKKWDLSAREAKQIADLCSMTPTTASDVSKRFKLSIQNASNRLRKWERADFLERVDRDAKSGGVEYVYLKAHKPKEPKP